MKALLTAISAFLAVSKFPDEVKAWFPEFFSALYKYFGVPSDDQILHRVVVLSCLAVVYITFTVIRKYIGYIIKSSAFKDAVNVSVYYRQNRIMQKMPGLQLASSLHAISAAAYFFIMFIIFESFMTPPPGDIFSFGLWKFFQILFLLIAGACCLLAVSRLRPLHIPSRRLRLKAEQKLREHFTKLGLPEVDQTNPRNGIVARIAKLDRGNPIAGLGRRYGGRSRRRISKFFSRFSARIIGKF